MTAERGPRRNPQRRLFVWAARLGLLCTSLFVALLLLVLLDPFLPGVDRPPDVQSEAFHHKRMPGVWVAEDYEWGPHLVYFDADGWREAPPAAAGEERLGRPVDRPAGAWGRASEPVRSAEGRLPEAATKASKRFRMAIMGDSFVESIQVTWEETFVARLEARSAGRVEVLNRANSSYSPLIGLLQWRRQVARERPTHLLLLLCPNDVADDRRYTASALRLAAGGETPSGGEVDDVARPDVNLFSWREPPPRPWRLNEGRLDRLYRRWRGRAGAVAVARHDLLRRPDRLARRWRVQNPALTSLTGGYLRELAADARKAGVEFALSAVPSSWEFRGPRYPPELRAGPTFADNVAAWAEANGVRHVDLQPAFRAAAARGGERLFFERDGHFTPAGHAVAAEVFAAAWPDLFAAADTPPVRGPVIRAPGDGRTDWFTGGADTRRPGAGPLPP